MSLKVAISQAKSQPRAKSRNNNAPKHKRSAPIETRKQRQQRRPHIAPQPSKMQRISMPSRSTHPGNQHRPKPPTQNGNQSSSLDLHNFHNNSIDGEVIRNIYGASDLPPSGRIITIPMNAGLVGTLPFTSTLAQRFSFAEWVRAMLIYRGETSLNTSSGTFGHIWVAICPNVNKPFTKESDFENADVKLKIVPWELMTTMKIPFKHTGQRGIDLLAWHYIRTSDAEPGYATDKPVYDSCLLQLYINTPSYTSTQLLGVLGLRFSLNVKNKTPIVPPASISSGDHYDVSTVGQITALNFSLSSNSTLGSTRQVALYNSAAPAISVSIPIAGAYYFTLIVRAATLAIPTIVGNSPFEVPLGSTALTATAFAAVNTSPNQTNFYVSGATYFVAMAGYAFAQDDVVNIALPTTTGVTTADLYIVPMPTAGVLPATLEDQFKALALRCQHLESKIDCQVAATDEETQQCPRHPPEHSDSEWECPTPSTEFATTTYDEVIYVHPKANSNFTYIPIDNNDSEYTPKLKMVANPLGRHRVFGSSKLYSALFIIVLLSLLCFTSCLQTDTYDYWFGRNIHAISSGAAKTQMYDSMGNAVASSCTSPQTFNKVCQDHYTISIDTRLYGVANDEFRMLLYLTQTDCTTPPVSFNAPAAGSGGYTPFTALVEDSVIYYTSETIAVTGVFQEFDRVTHYTFPYETTFSRRVCFFGDWSTSSGTNSADIVITFIADRPKLSLQIASYPNSLSFGHFYGAPTFASATTPTLKLTPFVPLQSISTALPSVTLGQIGSTTLTTTVPVSGTVAVSTLPAVAISGTVPVSISTSVPVTGTVAVSTLPAVTISGTVPVSVASAISVLGTVSITGAVQTDITEIHGVALTSAFLPTYEVGTASVNIVATHSVPLTTIAVPTTSSGGGVASEVTIANATLHVTVDSITPVSPLGQFLAFGANPFKAPTDYLFSTAFQDFDDSSSD